MVELDKIGKVFNKGTVDETDLFVDFSLTVRDGEFVSVVGSNGSGKTTMLNLIAGNISPDRGRILLNGKDVTAQKEFVRARKIGRVFQDPSKGSSPHMTVAENMALAENKGKPFNLTYALNKKRVEYYREMLRPMGLGIENKMGVKVGSLSGGQRQVLTLLMATMTPIDVLLLDEHTAALDPKTSEQIMQLTGDIVREKGLTTIMVTHNLRYAVEYGDRLLMMDKGKSVIDKSGEEKQALKVEDLLKTFNEISVECGN